MKNFLMIFALLGIGGLFYGCGNLTCDDMQKKVNERVAADKAYAEAVHKKNKDEATKQKDIIYKNCDSRSKMTTIKCKLKGDTEEVEYKATDSKACTDHKEAQEKEIHAIPKA